MRVWAMFEFYIMLGQKANTEQTTVKISGFDKKAECLPARGKEQMGSAPRRKLVPGTLLLLQLIQLRNLLSA